MISERREVDLPSGAVLRVQIAPFLYAKNLYQAILRELKSVSMAGEIQVAQVIKDAFCVGFSSPEIEKYLWECLKSCTYESSPGSGELKISMQTFEPTEARDDYMLVLAEVAKDNVGPFVKTLYADYTQATSLVAKMAKSPE